MCIFSIVILMFQGRNVSRSQLFIFLIEIQMCKVLYGCETHSNVGWRADDHVGLLVCKL